jgi:hypothetical protein
LIAWLLNSFLCPTLPRLYGWFQEWADIEAPATVLRWYEPLVVPGLLQTEDYARAILSARPDGNLDD